MTRWNTDQLIKEENWLKGTEFGLFITLTTEFGIFRED